MLTCNNIWLSCRRPTARHSASSSTCYKQRWTLSVINLQQPNWTDGTCDGQCAELRKQKYQQSSEFETRFHREVPRTLVFRYPNYLETQRRINRRKRLCRKPAGSIQPFQCSTIKWPPHAGIIFAVYSASGASVTSRGKNVDGVSVTQGGIMCGLWVRPMMMSPAYLSVQLQLLIWVYKTGTFLSSRVHGYITF